MVDAVHNIAGAASEQVAAASRASQAERDRGPAAEKVRQETRPASTEGDRQQPALVGAGKISEVVKEINHMVQQVATTKVSFDVDEATGRTVIRVVDKETGEVVRQVPTEELLTLVARMEQLSGLIFNQEV